MLALLFIFIFSSNTVSSEIDSRHGGGISGRFGLQSRTRPQHPQSPDSKMPSISPLPASVTLTNTQPSSLPSFTKNVSHRMLLLTRNDFGRYSNQREVLLETLALASYSGRDVAADPPPACRGGGLGYAYDVLSLEAALGVHVFADGAAAAAAAYCASEISRGALLTPLAGRHGGWGAPGTMVTWAGLPWPVVNASALAAKSFTGATPQQTLLERFGTAERAYAAPVYRDLRNPAMAFELPAYLGPSNLPEYSASASSAGCIALSVPFYAVNVAVTPGAYERAATALRPVPWLAAAVDAWLDARSLPRAPGQGGAPVVAMHVRLTDNLRRGVKSGRPWVDRCDDATTRVSAVAEVRTFFESRGLFGATVLFATDDAASPCIAALLDAFANAPARIFVDRPNGPDGEADPRVQAGDCLHSQFIQEVLARSDAFFGSALSTFSTAVHQIRVLQHNRPLNSSLML